MTIDQAITYAIEHAGRYREAEYELTAVGNVLEAEKRKSAATALEVFADMLKYRAKAQ